MTRRQLIVNSSAACAVAGLAPPFAFAAAPFSFETVKARALALSAKAFDDTIDPLPASLRDLDYAHYRMINFRSEHAIWRDHGRFRVQLFHRGFQYNRKVAINLVEAGAVTPVAYAPDLFDFRANSFATDFGTDIGFAGFRIHAPLNRADYFDEFAVFQGASYFRLVGKGQIYGLSARGLAIDTAEPEGEEFPWFKEFWLERPPETSGAHSKSLTIYALLDSRSTTGAYRFELTPAGITTADVEAALYPRRDIAKLGVAPLTSMFLHGKLANRPFADIHPEAHDSDGLAIWNGAGEALWRPLENPRLLRVSSFFDTRPRAFGLLQRERSFAAYEDPETGYEQRPDGWVEILRMPGAPDGVFGQGAVQLVEIPSDADSNDNMVAYWVPKAGARAGQKVEFAYRIGTGIDPRRASNLAAVAETRVGPLVPVEDAREDRHAPMRLAVTFTGAILGHIDPARAPDPDLTASFGTVSDARVERLANGAWRVDFVFTPDPHHDSELRLALKQEGRTISETWTYRWSVDAQGAPV